MKATIVLYSDMFELDRTEVSYSTQKQLRAIVESLASDNVETQLVEVYCHPSLALSYKYTRPRRGAHLKEQKVSDHPNWGGYRPGSGAKPKPADDVLSVRVEIAVRKDMAAVLDSIKGESRASFIRKAIADRLRQVQQVTVDPLPKPYPKPAPKDDQRYRRALHSLPATLRRYEGNERTCIPLHIDRTEDGWHVYYGLPDQQEPDAPSFQAPRLIIALEDLARWLAMHRNKWVVGSSEATTNRAETVRKACEKTT